jgi:hypothetical protein
MIAGADASLTDDELWPAVLAFAPNTVGAINVNNVITATTAVQVCCLVQLEGISGKELQESLLQ